MLKLTTRAQNLTLLKVIVASSWQKTEQKVSKHPKTGSLKSRIQTSNRTETNAPQPALDQNLWVHFARDNCEQGIQKNIFNCVEFSVTRHSTWKKYIMEKKSSNGKKETYITSWQSCPLGLSSSGKFLNRLEVITTFADCKPTMSWFTDWQCRPCNQHVNILYFCCAFGELSSWLWVCYLFFFSTSKKRNFIFLFSSNDLHTEYMYWGWML